MVKPLIFSLVLSTAVFGALSARAETAPFQCKLHEVHTFLPEFPTFSGYRWIECLVVGLEVADVDGVAVNNGTCETFDYWYAGRSFARGQAINIPYACMSPVTVTIAASGVTSRMKLR